MDNKTHLRYEARANIIKAMAHPSRLFIIEELQKGERCVNELTEMIGSDMSTISKHLSILKNAGIVGIRKEGTNIYYFLKVTCILGFLGCINEVIDYNMTLTNEIFDKCKV